MRIIFFLIFICSSSLCLSQYKQKQVRFVTAELGGGLLNTTYTSPTLIDMEKTNVNLNASIGFMAELSDEFLVEGGLGQTFRYWNLEGTNDSNTLKINNRQNFPSGFVGGYYQYGFGDSRQKKNHYVFLGGKVQADFIDFESLNDTDGSDANYVEASTTKDSKLSLNLTPELGTRNNFNSGNFWAVSVKYNIALNGDILEGTAQQIINGTVRETIDFNANGQYIGLGIKYGIWVK